MSSRQNQFPTGQIHFPKKKNGDNKNIHTTCEAALPSRAGSGTVVETVYSSVKRSFNRRIDIRISEWIVWIYWIEC